MGTPTQRSRELLEAEGYTVALVEKYNAWAQVRTDLFGFADLLAVGNSRTVAIQSTTDSNFVGAQKEAEGMRCSEHMHCRGLGYRNSRVEEAIESLVLSARDCEAGVMRIFPGYDSRSPTLQKSPLVGECMRGIIDDKFRTAYIDRNALIFSGDFVRLWIKYDDGAVSAALKRLRVSRAGTWWGESADGIFQIGTLVQPTAIEKVVALTTEVLVNNPSWPLRGASPETVAHFAELARDVMSEWASLGHIEGERFPGLDAVNYYSPTYRAPLCCPK